MTTPLPPNSLNPTTGQQITTSQPAQNGSTGLWTQPPFDSRISSVTWPMTGGAAQQLQRGFMIWDTTTGIAQSIGYAPGTAAQVNFLFNPSQVTASYQITDASIQAKLMLPAAGDPGHPFIPLQQTVEFALLFDRTYELWSLGTGQNVNTTGNINPATSLSTIGVDVDIRAIRQFTGMTAPTVNAANTQTAGGNGALVTGGAIAPGTPGGLSQGIMMPIRSYVYFGAPGTGISFFGYISDWNVTYTHFNALMIPVRAAVDITFTLLPIPAQTVTPATSVFSNTTGTVPGINFPATGALPTAGVGGR